jgi:hypothetical protein
VRGESICQESKRVRWLKCQDRAEPKEEEELANDSAGDLNGKSEAEETVDWIANS